MKSLLTLLPEDVEQLIYRYVHEMAMSDVLRSLQQSTKLFNLIFQYLQRRAFYPYLIRYRLYNSVFFNEISSNYFTNKVYKYIHYKLLSKCLLSITTITTITMPNQHIVFDD